MNRGSNWFWDLESLTMTKPLCMYKPQFLSQKYVWMCVGKFLKYIFQKRKPFGGSPHFLNNICIKWGREAQFAMTNSIMHLVPQIKYGFVLNYGVHWIGNEDCLIFFSFLQSMFQNLSKTCSNVFVWQELRFVYAQRLRRRLSLWVPKMNQILDFGIISLE